MQHLDECVDTEGLDKWGWVFYRCTYSNDDAWSRFKEKITQSFQEEIEDSGSPELTARLRERFDLTFFEDKDLFNGVTKDQLRAHFRQWAAETFRLENPRGIPSLPGDSPWQRYRYFIQIDDDALRSNFECPQAYGYPRGCYVKFVDGYWKSLYQVNLKNSTPRNCRDINPEHEKPFEPIEGCVQENLGWMKLSTLDMSTEFYVNIGGNDNESWRTFYKRPPAITKW